MRGWWCILALGCSAAEGTRAHPEPQPEPVDLFADLSFLAPCASVTVDVYVDVEGLSYAAPVPATCIGVRPEEIALARSAIEESCVAAEVAPLTCAGAAADAAAELARLSERRRTRTVTFFPEDAAALPISGSDAVMELGFVGGSSERWAGGTREWGDRYLHLDAHGEVSAQGSILFEPSPGAMLACEAVRDHTMAGRILAPGELALEFHELSELTCDAGVTLAVDVLQTVASAAAG